MLLPDTWCKGPMFRKTWEESEMKDALVYNIANHMKKCFLNWNKDTVQDEVILKHLTELSEGKLIVNESDLPLTDSSELLTVSYTHLTLPTKA
mgnify:CR=1 FL=1